jgi:hypothetical protein
MNTASTSQVTRAASYAKAIAAPPTTNTSATTPRRARRSLSAVKARSISALPNRTSWGSDANPVPANFEEPVKNDRVGRGVIMSKDDLKAKPGSAGEFAAIPAKII